MRGEKPNFLKCNNPTAIANTKLNISDEGIKHIKELILVPTNNTSVNGNQDGLINVGKKTKAVKMTRIVPPNSISLIAINNWTSINNK